MGIYRLFGSENGPSTPIPGPSSTVMGVVFEVTTGGCWLDGYWWWVCPATTAGIPPQSTAPQTFTLWMPYPPLKANNGVVVPGTTVTSGELTPGQWNFVPLASPVALSIGTFYLAMTGVAGSYPCTPNQWGPGNRYDKGLANGPLLAAADGTPFTGEDDGIGQEPVAAGEGTNPAKYMPVFTGYPPNANYWIDPQISTEAPPGASLRLWPGMPIVGGPGGIVTSDTSEQSAATEFWLSAAYDQYTLNKIWFWSPIPSALGGTTTKLLPSSCAIFDVSTQGIYPETQRGVTGPNPDPASMPDWRKPDGTVAKPGDGWVYCAYEGITLPPGKYKTAIYCYAAGSGDDSAFAYFGEQPFYFGPALDASTPGTAPNGIVNGPLTAPNVTSATEASTNGTVPGDPPAMPGNSTYQNNTQGTGGNSGTFLYPDTFDDKDNGETRWIDVEVTPVPQPTPPLEGTLLAIFP